MRIISKVAAIALVLFALVPAVTAGAQAACPEGVYVCANEPDAGGSDAGGGGAAETPGPSDTGGRPTDTPRAEETRGPAGGPANAPSGALPITGGDVVGMASIGAVAIALGAVLVRRSKVTKQQAA